ncbi:MAG: hypothetical protein HC815_22765 [Richelia sp. RM1_1_1]|nr:hypothetical protein [Richelia sp. RM1_1_1]
MLTGSIRFHSQHTIFCIGSAIALWNIGKCDRLLVLGALKVRSRFGILGNAIAFLGFRECDGFWGSAITCFGFVRVRSYFKILKRSAIAFLSIIFHLTLMLKVRT